MSALGSTGLEVENLTCHRQIEVKHLPREQCCICLELGKEERLKMAKGKMLHRRNGHV